MTTETILLYHKAYAICANLELVASGLKHPLKKNTNASLMDYYYGL